MITGVHIFPFSVNRFMEMYSFFGLFKNHDLIQLCDYNN